jgi:hypothetical integral membrane protein (TIGR02206 family)
LIFLLSFFSGVERPEPVVISPWLRIALLTLWLGGMFTIVANRERWKARAHPERPARIMAAILLLDQIVLYAWQFGSGYFNLPVSLPLYHCRISVPFLILDLLFGVKALRSIWIYWGLLGSVFAMGFMDLYRFDFPHYTNFQFFIVHILLGWVIIYTIFVLDYRFDRKNLVKTLVVTLVYNVFLIGINAWGNGSFIPYRGALYNYGYVTLPPPSLHEVVLSMWPGLYYIIMLLGYEVLILIQYGFGRVLNRVADREAEQRAGEGNA